MAVSQRKPFRRGDDGEIPEISFYARTYVHAFFYSRREYRKMCACAYARIYVALSYRISRRDSPNFAESASPVDFQLINSLQNLSIDISVLARIRRIFRKSAENASLRDSNR